MSFLYWISSALLYITTVHIQKCQEIAFLRPSYLIMGAKGETIRKPQYKLARKAATRRQKQLVVDYNQTDGVCVLVFVVGVVVIQTMMSNYVCVSKQKFDFLDVFRQVKVLFVCIIPPPRLLHSLQYIYTSFQFCTTRITKQDMGSRSTRRYGVCLLFYWYVWLVYVHQSLSHAEQLRHMFYGVNNRDIFELSCRIVLCVVLCWARLHTTN